METLTPELWRTHHTRLRPYVLAEWPEMDEEALNTLGNDFDALVDLVAATAGISTDLARGELTKIQVNEEDLGGQAAGLGAAAADSASLEQLRLGPGFRTDDREMIVSELQKLDRRLRKFPADASELEITVQQRGDTAQEVILEAWLPKFPHLVAKSGEHDLRAALREVRENMWRQIDDAVNRRKEVR